MLGFARAKAAGPIALEMVVRSQYLFVTYGSQHDIRRPRTHFTVVHYECASGLDAYVNASFRAVTIMTRRK
jgi:hypothetical protein